MERNIEKLQGKKIIDLIKNGAKKEHRRMKGESEESIVIVASTYLDILKSISNRTEEELYKDLKAEMKHGYSVKGSVLDVIEKELHLKAFESFNFPLGFSDRAKEYLLKEYNDYLSPLFENAEREVEYFLDIQKLLKENPRIRDHKDYQKKEKNLNDGYCDLLDTIEDIIEEIEEGEY